MLLMWLKELFNKAPHHMTWDSLHHPLMGIACVEAELHETAWKACYSKIVCQITLGDRKSYHLSQNLYMYTWWTLKWLLRSEYFISRFCFCFCFCGLLVKSPTGYHNEGGRGYVGCCARSSKRGESSWSSRHSCSFVWWGSRYSSPSQSSDRSCFGQYDIRVWRHIYLLLWTLFLSIECCMWRNSKRQPWDVLQTSSCDIIF